MPFYPTECKQLICCSILEEMETPSGQIRNYRNIIQPQYITTMLVCPAVTHEISFLQHKLNTYVLSTFIFLHANIFFPQTLTSQLMFKCVDVVNFRFVHCSMEGR